MKHTRAPWEAHPHGGYCFLIHSRADPLAPRIATVNYPSGAHSRGLADASVIAAAPDLLAALVALNSALDAYWNIGPEERGTGGALKAIEAAQQASKAAIEKAEPRHG